MSRQAVSKWERSESSPDTDNLIALAQLYGVSLDDLLYVDDDIKDDVSFEAACRAAERRDEVRPHGGGAVGACGAGGMGVGAAAWVVQVARRAVLRLALPRLALAARPPCPAPLRPMSRPMPSRERPR